MYEITAEDCIVTKGVADWIVSYDVTSAPAEVRQAAPLTLLDTLGVMITSARRDVGIHIIKGARALDSSGSILVPGSDARFNLATGALVIGTIGHGVELDEVHLPTTQHIGATACAAAIALGQHLDASLDQVLDAINIGYEITGHLGIAIGVDQTIARGFHLTGVIAGFGCAAVAARLLKLDAATAYHMLGLTAAQAAGTVAWHTEDRHMTKSFQMGASVRNGITAAILAQSGCTGPLSVFGGPINIMWVLSGVDGPAWHEDLGRRFEIMNSARKYYAAGRPMHAAIDAMLQIRKKHVFDIADIVAVDVHMPPSAALIVDGNPTNNIDCRTVVATTAIDRAFSIDQAQDERMNRPDVQELKHKTKLIHDEALNVYFPRNWPSIVKVRLKDGQQIEEKVVVATGERERPMGLEAVTDKFHTLADPVIGKDAAGRLIELITGGQNPKLREIARQFAVGCVTAW